MPDIIPSASGGEQRPTSGRAAAKARVRAKVAAAKAMPARDRIYHLLCATYTHAEAEALLAEVERNAAQGGVA